ncbi:hypothetical protein HDU76_007618 [Blyttiomyces sp. JEL0837]|nr:hypothetical protein HDU76_007618 [Blyttiomyces sp. JEL0837]
MGSRFNLNMSRGATIAKADVCIEAADGSVKLLLRKVKNSKESEDGQIDEAKAEAELAAEAIAAFQHNNRIRLERGQTEKLSQHVAAGTQPIGHRDPKAHRNLKARTPSRINAFASGRPGACL